ncbi:hypothetical protein Bbelb_346080 [Branchiostoma belcheri]|nr:hypothetical protein Bbelb_346080 [Branchiostoma belcheri]
MAHLPVFLIILAVVSFRPSSATEVPGPVVKTKYGPIQGVYVEQGSMFLGIPFAAPPVGDLRWKPPQPASPWAPGTFKATNFSSACVPIRVSLSAPDSDTSEDCLYLNVFVPTVTNTSEKLPVFFWIHGGDFLLGSAMDSMYDGRFLANSTRTVVVAANYRLSALGFLVAGQGEGSATGNFGILDQIAALQWIQDNIADFGGDKDRVTIFGQSAGAYSVVLHMTLDKSDHLFRRAIAASPPLSLFFKTRLEALLFGDDFARLLNCTPGDMQCMRSASTTDIAKVQTDMLIEIQDPFQRLIEHMEPWGPTIDGDLISNQVMDAFENGRFQNKPFIVGSTTEEAVMFVSCVFAKLPAVEYEAVVYGLFPADAEKVLRAYPPSGSGDERSVAVQLVTHYLFSCPVRKTLRNAERRGDSSVWLYVFSHALPQGWPRILSCCDGHVCHATDLFFEFQSLKLTKYNYTHDEQILADSMAYYYGNFAYTGDPNKPGPHLAQVQTDIPWPPYLQSNGFRNVRFDVPKDSIEEQYLEERCDFWDSIKPYP